MVTSLSLRCASNAGLACFAAASADAFVLDVNACTELTGNDVLIFLVQSS